VILKKISLFVLSALLIQSKAYAYLDMGTGSYIIQAVLAGVFTGIYFIKAYWLKLKMLFSSLTKKKDKIE
jgi:hypothetical protein